MPEAIATSKRRFYKALDALSTPVSLSPASATPSTGSTKRSSTAAFDEARDRIRKRLRQSHSNTSLSAADDTTSVIHLPHPSRSPSNAPPHPTSRSAFLSRLKTFSNVSVWHPKPTNLSEVEFAKRGWVCVDVNTVGCRSCGKRVVVKIASGSTHSEDDEEGAAVEDALVERFKHTVVEGHAPTCLWRKTGCSDEIYRLPVVQPAAWQPELRERFQSLSTIQNSVSNITTRSLDAHDPSLLEQLPPDLLTYSAPSDEARRCFEIAMHGWRGSSESGNDLLRCDACFQRLGLWMYQPRDHDAGVVQDESDSDVDASIVDLVEMHRDHCPWRNPASQHATGSLTGLNACQVLHRVVSTAARDHRRRSQKQTNGVTDELNEEHSELGASASGPRDETARQDKERESRIRKLKNLLHIKRRSGSKLAPRATAK